METLSAEEQDVVATVRDFVDREVRPVVRELEHANTYPEALIEQMQQLGIFGLAIPEPWGEAPVSMPCYALVTAELSRGWMSLAGAMGGHTVVAKLLLEFGTDEQKDRWLPRMATGEVRATMALTEPGGGSDLQAMTTAAKPTDDGYVVNGAKTWITNSRRSQLIALLCKTDPAAEPKHRGVSILLVEHGPGLTVSRDLPKLGYKGVESCELSFDDLHVGKDALLGGTEGRGFAQMMKGLETGRIQVASRALGVGRAAFDDAFRYAQERESFGKPIWQHQSIGNYLADMATKLTAARQLIMHAAQKFETGQRCDLEAGMAKLFASEVAMEVALNAVRIHGGYGYSTEFDVERYFRDAPLMIVGEGTNEIQRNVIAGQLVKRGGLGVALSGSALQPLRSGGQLSERVAAQLREAIMVGDLRAPAFVRTEHVAAELGVSATPVREALMLLSSEGIVRWQPRRGFRVEPVTRGDVVDLFAVQAHVAGELAARAALALDEGEVARLRGVQARLEAAAADGTVAEVGDLNHEIHRTVNKAAGARRLAAVLASTVRYVPRTYFGRVDGWAAASAHEHEPVIAALAQCDGEAARVAMQEHVDHIGRLLVAHLDTRGAFAPAAPVDLA